MAPADFGEFSNDLLVGNFAGGQINAYDPQTGAWQGALTDSAGNPVAIPELWALDFGTGGDGGAPDALYFTAGIGHESHGLFGSLQPSSAGAAGSQDSTLANSLENGTLVGNANASDGGDNYPLPPSNGPLVRANAGVPEQLQVTLAPVNGSALAMIPTLATTGAASSTPPPLVVNIPPANGPHVGLLGETAMAEMPAGAVEIAQASRALGAWERSLAVSAVGDQGDQRTGADGVFNLASANAGDKGQRPAPDAAAPAAAVQRSNAQQTFAMPDEERSIAQAAAATPLEWVAAKDSWMVQAWHVVALVVLGGCAVQYIRKTRSFIFELPLTTIKCLWSRVSSRTARTVVITAGPAAAS